MKTTAKPKRAKKRELGHDPILVSVCDIFEAPENDKLYKPVTAADVTDLTASIRKHGLMEPLVLTLDNYILSGHRRFAAAIAAGLDHVPCRFEQVRRRDDFDAFVVLLREYNRQRVKTSAERLREELVSINPTNAHRALRRHRAEANALTVGGMQLEEGKARAVISDAKLPFLNAAVRVLNENRLDGWPAMSIRQVHYRLLNDPPLKHASKPDSAYRNDPASYKSLVDLLTRARLTGVIPFSAIADETRPVSDWHGSIYMEPGIYIRRQISGMFNNYYRNLLQSQIDHIELLVEKNTAAGPVQKVAWDFTIPVTSGRGFCSLPPRYEMAQRYRQSGKRSLVLLIVSDFDADGEEIAHSFARSMRDDFNIKSIQPIKVALTYEQTQQMQLPAACEAKCTSTNFKAFTKRYGNETWELEALPPRQLQQIVRDAVHSVLDVDAFNGEVEREEKDAHFLAGVRGQVITSLREMGFSGDEVPAPQ